MQSRHSIKTELEKVFRPRQASVLAKVIVDAYSELVKTDDFNELKEIVRDIGIKTGELAEAQKGSEKRLTRLEASVKELTEDVRKLTKAIVETKAELSRAIDDTTRTNLGGLSDSVRYSLENESYRGLPLYLKEKHGIEVTERFIRTEIGGEEINIFGIGKRDGVKVLIIGEAELKLKSVGKFTQLDKKVSAVKGEYKEDIVKILITHYASPSMIEKAKANGIIVVQSFEWS